MHGQKNIKTNWFQSKGSTGISPENVTYQTRLVLFIVSYLLCVYFLPIYRVVTK